MKRLYQAAALLLALAAVAGMLWFGAKQYFDQEDHFLPGQNYSSEASIGQDLPE